MYVQDIMASHDIRSAIGELRQILTTPMRAYDSALDELSASDNNPTGRRSSESDCPTDADLPGLITRVLGKRESAYLCMSYQHHCLLSCMSSVRWLSFQIYTLLW